MSPETPANPASDAKFQALCRSLLGAFYMLVRSVKLYDPENAVFQKPLAQLLETVNFLVAKEGKLDLAVVNGAFFVNGQLVRLDAGAAEHVRLLIAEMEAHKVGGFSVQKPSTVAELKNFVWVFAKEAPGQEEVAEDGLDGRKLVSMKLTRWSKLKEKLDNADSTGSVRVDRKKYALTLYARTVFWADKMLQAMQAGTPFPTFKAAQLIQDLVEVSVDRTSNLLGMSTNGPPDQALAYHLVNTALIAIAFGSELGLSNGQLKELGVAALLNEAGLVRLPPEVRLRLRPEALGEEEQRQRAQVDQETATRILSEPGARRLQFLRALSCVQMHQPFGKPVLDAQGQIQKVEPLGDPLYFSRILAICSYFDVLTSTTTDHEAFGPEVALSMMWNTERWRFDEELLGAFLKVMERAPVKALSEDEGRVIDLSGA